MTPEFYLISDGTLNLISNTLLVEVDSISFTLDEAIDHYAENRGIPRGDVIANPVGARIR